MISISLILTYLSCLSSDAMLNMLLLLIAAYISAAIWLISHHVIYTGLLYILVCVWAIVVLIMFVVQLTNTTLTYDNLHRESSLVLLQNTVLVISLTIFLFTAYNSFDNLMLLRLTYWNLDSIQCINGKSNLISEYLSGLNLNQNNLTTLASSIFNDYGYVLVLFVNAIVLAVIGPIKLASAPL